MPVGTFNRVFGKWAVLTLAVAGLAAAQQQTRAPSEFVAWLPISDAERAQKAPAVEKDAGAEILLWRVHVVDEFLSDGELQRVLYHYIRLKIFDQRGKEKASTIDLPYQEPGAVLDVSGRTIKADGSIVELAKSSIFRRDVVKSGGFKEKVVSFAMPAVEEGSILEYRWKQTENDNRFRYLRLQFAREFPVQLVSYFVRPLSSEYVAADPMSLMPFHCRPTPFKLTNDGWNQTDVQNVPASHTEPYSPSKANTEPWALLYYRSGGSKDPEKFWMDQGRKTYNDIKALVRVDNDAKAAAAKATGSASTPEAKLTALILYVRDNIKNLYDPQVTDAQRNEFVKKLPKDRRRNSSEILKSGIGMPQELNVAFAAVAQAAGLDVRPALVADRDEVAFAPTMIDTYFLDNVAMALKAGDKWKIFDVGRKYTTPGMLPWELEGQFALVTDAKTPIVSTSAFATPDANAEHRTAKLKLDAQGKLTGEVEETYDGHSAESHRERFLRQSAAQREEWFHDSVVKMFPDAQVTDIKVENVEDPSKPMRVRYKLEAPQFAQVAGDRILFQPNAFKRSQASLFTDSKRVLPVEFPFAMKEVEDLTLELPEGFTLDSADAPSPMDFGKPGGYKIAIRVSSGATTTLLINRELVFADNGNVVFSVDQYPTIKRVFDQVALNDSHSLALKKK